MAEIINIGDGVYVKSKDEKGIVIDNRSWPTITVRLLLDTVVVNEGDYEKR